LAGSAFVAGVDRLSGNTTRLPDIATSSVDRDFAAA
jgi:hypothetical protein